MPSSYPEQKLTLDRCRVHLYKRGEPNYIKASYPVRTGIFSEVATDKFIYHFNLNHEVIRVSGRTGNWPHPHEWLKRTMGNDWIYYSTGGYTGVFETTGEYYLPNLRYQTNNLLGGAPFNNDYIAGVVEKWYGHLKKALLHGRSLPPETATFLSTIRLNTPTHLKSRAEAFAACCGGEITVLPPDTRHVDYNVIPLQLSEGCLFKCRFCSVKNGKPFCQ